MMKKAAVIKHFGSQGKIARALGITKGAVSQWDDDLIPQAAAQQIEVITCGKLRVDPTSYPYPPKKKIDPMVAA